MKNIIFYIAAVFLFLLSLAFGYFIIVNTALKDLVLADVTVASEGNSKIVNFVIDDEQIPIPITQIIQQINEEDRKEFGKGADILGVVSKAPQVIKGETVTEAMSIDTEKFLNILPFNISTNYFAYFEGSTIKNCEPNSFNFEINYEQIDTLINDQTKVLDNEQYIDFEQIVNNPQELEVYKACQRYNTGKKRIEDYLSSVLEGQKYKFGDLFRLDYKNGIATWKIQNYSKITDLLKDYKKKTDTKVDNGEYIEIDGYIALLKMYTQGKYLDIDKTMKTIGDWINNQDSLLNFSYTTIQPSILSGDKEVLDFTKEVGSGRTRIDLIRNGQGNSAVYFAELGLDEVDNHIIWPGEEFSYLKAIDKQPGLALTGSGRLIGMGYCNSTTTIFRAALETGLPITERTPHGYNVPSYDWGYPYNIVDSTFWGGEDNPIDLKFVNTFSYPILLRVKKDQDGEGFQFHTVSFYSNQNAKIKEVELYDWKIWNVQSTRYFDGSFRRSVKVDGVEVLNDEFISRYR